MKRKIRSIPKIAEKEGTWTHIFDTPDVTTQRCVSDQNDPRGGVPRYLELFTEVDDFESALVEGVLKPGAPLHMEARYLLQDEIDGLEKVC